MARKPKLSKEQKVQIRKDQKEAEQLLKNGEHLRSIFPVLDKFMGKPTKNDKIDALMMSELGKNFMAGMMVNLMKSAILTKTKKKDEPPIQDNKRWNPGKVRQGYYEVLPGQPGYNRTRGR